MGPLCRCPGATATRRVPVSSPDQGPPGGARYVVSLLGNRHEVEICPDGRVVVDGRGHDASLAATSLPHGHSLLLDGSSFALLARRARRGVWDLQLDGRSVPAEVLDARTARVRELSAAAGWRAEIAALRAPMPGLVVRVAVGEGDAVEEGDTVLIVEAMKMENELRANAAARVRRVMAAPGEAVEKGQVLVEFGELETA